MNRLPSSTFIPTSIDSMSDGEVRDLAEAYLDLLRLMTEALEVCETPVAFFSWSGRGFVISGHPPTELIETLKGATS